jgi:hypothetical protein
MLWIASSAPPPRNHLHRTAVRFRNSRHLRAGYLALGAEFYHGGDLTDELDLEAVLYRMQYDALDEPAQNLQRFRVHFGIGQRRMQVGDLAAIDLGQVGVEERRRRWRGSMLGLQHDLALLQLVELGL